jgi:hypothetical protein
MRKDVSKAPQNKNRHGERGIALIAALLMLLLVSAVAVGMILASDTESSISSNFRDEQTALFSARGGVEEVRDRLRSTATNSLATTVPTNQPGNDDGVLYIINPQDGEVVAPWNTAGTNFPDTEICKEVPCAGGVPGGTPWFKQAVASPAYAATPKLPWKWVRVNPKINKMTSSNISASVDGSSQDGTALERVCWNGKNEVVAATSCANLNPNYQQVYEMSALSVTPRGSRRMVQMDFAREIPANVAVPAAVTIDSNAQPQCQLQGGSISGVDHANPPGASVAGVGVSAIGGGCQIAGSNVNGGGNCATNPNVCSGLPMGAALTPGLVGEGGLPDTMNRLIAGADQTFAGNPPGGANLGDAGNPLTTVVNSPGNFIGGFSGAGVLIINAGGQEHLQIDGNLHWKGVIIVYSNADEMQVMIDDGSGKIDGGLLLASNNSSQFTFVVQSGGFAGGINYNTAYLTMNNTASKPLRAIATRELLY